MTLPIGTWRSISLHNPRLEASTTFKPLNCHQCSITTWLEPHLHSSSSCCRTTESQQPLHCHPDFCARYSRHGFDSWSQTLHAQSWILWKLSNWAVALSCCSAYAKKDTGQEEKRVLSYWDMYKVCISCGVILCSKSFKISSITNSDVYRSWFIRYRLTFSVHYVISNIWYSILQEPQTFTSSDCMHKALSHITKRIHSPLQEDLKQIQLEIKKIIK